MQEFLSTLDIATTILLLLLCLGAWVLWKVQKNPENNFDFEEMLRDESGKPSAFRLAIFVSLAVSTWIIMYITLNTNALDTWMFVTYLGIWSGAKVAETAIIAYQGRGNTSSDREYSPDYKYGERHTNHGRYDVPRRRGRNNTQDQSRDYSREHLQEYDDAE